MTLGAAGMRRALLALSLVASACGSASASRPPASASTTTTTTTSASSLALPVTLTDATGAEVTVSSVSRIVPVDGDLAEIVFALGLGSNVVAVDLSATYPPAVEALPVIGYQRALSPEPIAAVEPTIVLATDLAGPREVLDQLRTLDIPVVLIQREMSLDGPAAKIRAVAAALGVPERGRALAAAVQREIDAAASVGSAVTDRPRIAAMYLRGDSVQLIMGAGTGIDVLIPALGGVDVAAELEIVDTRQLTAEALLLAAPEVLLVTTTGLESVGGMEGLLAVPGIAETPAGRARRVLAYEDQYLLGLGPRTGELMTELIGDLHPSLDATDPADLPTIDLPTTDLPTTDLPTTDLPTTDLPTTDLPTTREPHGGHP